jgi:uncharacterized protein (DUF433 family)
MEPTHSTIANHIEQTPGVRSGKPRIRGTRVTVSDVVLWTEQGMSADQIVSEFPQLGLADVYAALAYYHDNQNAIDREIQQSREFAEQLRSQLGQSKDADGTEISS